MNEKHDIGLSNALLRNGIILGVGIQTWSVQVDVLLGFQRFVGGGFTLIGSFEIFLINLLGEHVEQITFARIHESADCNDRFTGR